MKFIFQTKYRQFDLKIVLNFGFQMTQFLELNDMLKIKNNQTRSWSTGQTVSHM